MRCDNLGVGGKLLEQQSLPQPRHPLLGLGKDGGSPLDVVGVERDTALGRQLLDEQKLDHPFESRAVFTRA
jgi:hypothetical protein